MPAVTVPKGISNMCPRALALVMVGLVLILLTSPFKNAVPKDSEAGIQAIQQAPQELAKPASPVRVDDLGGVPNNKSAKIVTCPRCRLNSLPRVKEFVSLPRVKEFVYDHAKLFEPKLKVDFILGEDPVLHLYDDGKEVKEIDLESYDSKKIIQTLVQFGIHPRTDTDVVREALENS